MKGAGWWLLLACSIAAALFFEWHTDEVTVVLAVMSILALLLGGLRPDRAILGGALLGFSIAAAHGVTEAAATMRPHYMHSAPAAGDWAAMMLAGLFVTGLAWVAGWVRSRTQSSHAA